MDKEIVYSAVNQLFADCPGNIVAEDVAICPETAGVVLYEAPLVGIGDIFVLSICGSGKGK